MYMIFDTETSGLPITRGYDKYHDPALTHYYDRSRVVQLGYILLDESCQEISRKEFLIKPEGFVISKELTAIHGISQENAEKNGLPFSTVAKEFGKDLEKTKVIVAHNILFDYHVLSAEFLRHGFSDIHDEFTMKRRICTMVEGEKKFGQRQKLSKLYQTLYGKEWKQTHTALDDSVCCKLCFLKLK